MNLQPPALPHREQSLHVVQVGVGQENGGNGSSTESAIDRMKFGTSEDLIWQIRRSVYEKPFTASAADGDGRLSERRDLPMPRGPAIGATAIPLRQTTASGSAEDSNSDRGLRN